jgi:prepilin-type N-terminal cleavage/methylation domain-containing protein
MNRVTRQTGFTLIELMLAMTFISVLLLAIAMTIIQIGTIYNRGVTLKEVSQAARSISDELNRSIAAAEVFDLETNYITTTAGGRLCTGSYSYLWNYQKAFNEADNMLANYEGSNTSVRLVKVSDLGAIYCAKNADDSLSHKDIRLQDTNKAVELLSLGDHTLALHQFSVTSSDSATDTATGQQLYEVSFTIGTSDLAALNETMTGCKGPNEEGSDLAYCSVQNFTLVVRAGNRVN